VQSHHRRDIVASAAGVFLRTMTQESATTGLALSLY